MAYMMASYIRALHETVKIVLEQQSFSPYTGQYRFVLCGLNPKKPDMTCYFKPFEEEYVNLSQAGFQWQNPTDQSWRHVEVHPSSCVCVAVARP